jgi:predicted TIM-barrel fold metal-dependent hydrolase
MKFATITAAPMIAVPRINCCTLVCLLACWFQAASPVVVRSAIPAADGRPEVKVIDMHTHVFNARDLPLIGILTAKAAPRPVAEVVADAILSSMKEEEGEPIRTVRIGEVERPRLRELSALERNILFDYVGRDRAELLRQAAGRLEVSSDVTLLAETIARIGFPPGENLEASIMIKTITVAPQLADALKGYVRFIGIMTRQHGEIVATLELKYPQVDLFVHHMMDMGTGYDDETTVPFDKQLPMMQKLDQAFPGKLLHFAAFDPFRRKAALPLAEEAFSNFGAVGWKIYPPSGYRAAENATLGFPPRPSWVPYFWLRRQWNRRYDGWMPKELDDTLQGAFSRAVTTKTVPLFTHCTPGGFEAARDYGKMADPNFWATALDDRRNAGLRLCFGHSGGEDYWFSDTANDSNHQANSQKDPWQFGNKVVELCLTYPDVYCEVGYLDGILDPKKAALLSKRLESVLNRPSKDRKWKFGDKIMYGTDWHMIYKEPDYDKYLARWDEVIKKINGGIWRQAFFAGNAKKFLRLDELAKDPRFTPEQQKEWLALSK